MNCKQLEHTMILSEDTRDFICSPSAALRLKKIGNKKFCTQDIGFGYQVVYLSKEEADPINLERYSYASIPKCYARMDTNVLDQAGISSVQNHPTFGMMGEGVLIGVIDTGIDYQNPVFCNVDGSTRILSIWDQTLSTGKAPEGFAFGTEFSRAEINRALQSKDPLQIVPTKDDEEGHGTFLTSVAAGGVDVDNGFSGIAPKSTIAVVKLKETKKYLKQFYCIDEKAKCYQENDIMLAIRYLTILAKKNQMPLVICLALGTNQGDHSGASPLGTIISEYGALDMVTIVLGSGNEANQRHHFCGKIEEKNAVQSVEIHVNEGVQGFAMELWTEIPNLLAVSIVSPTGERIPFVSLRQSVSSLTYRFVLEKTVLHLDYRLFVEGTNAELIFLRFENPAEGTWKLEVKASSLADGEFHVWLPIKEFLKEEVFFLEADSDMTLTEPGCVRQAITVAFYNGNNNSIAIDSGRGYTRNRVLKPDFSAPGMEIPGVNQKQRFVKRSGSSLSVAVTAGAVALLDEWLYYRIGRRNMNMKQMRDLLVLGVKTMHTEAYPNRSWGYGALDLYHTFEVLQSF